MAKLRINEKGHYYVRSSYKSTVHFYSFEMDNYLKKNALQVGDNLPISWKTHTKKFQFYYEDKRFWKKIKKKYNSKIFFTKCPVCEKDTFFYSNDNGSKVYFDCIGKPWIKHPCFEGGGA